MTINRRWSRTRLANAALMGMALALPLAAGLASYFK
jgi:hypothetical protein